VTKSANDVAVVFAEHMSGTESKFADRMTRKAKDLGLDHTTFRNASGLPNKAQTSTARDLSKLAEAMFLDHREYYNYFSTPEFRWKKRAFANHNTLLKSVDGVDGIKTGFTNASGYNLMASAQRDGHRVIAVMLGGSSGKSRDAHVADLLNAAFYEVNGKGDQPEAVALMQKIAFGEVETVEPVYATMADRLAAGQLKQFAAAGETTEEGDEGPGDDADAPDGEDTSTVENDDADTPTPKVDPLAGNLLKASAPAPVAPIVAAPTLVAAPVANSLTAAPVVEKASVQASAPLPSLAPPAAVVAAPAPAPAPAATPFFQGPVLEHPTTPAAN
jgi:D-alanyl-D-alanine carboxypeptidase